jgi:hypothetical protein
LPTFLVADAESRGDHAQGILGVKLRADQLGGHHFLGIEIVEQAAHDRRLAGTHLAGNDDEAFVLIQAILQVSHRPPVLFAGEIERGIGIELKGLAGQAIERLVHVARSETVREGTGQRALGIAARTVGNHPSRADVGVAFSVRCW